MTQEQKEFLLKDISPRLPYGVKLGFYAEATKETYTCTLLGLEPQNDRPVIAKTDSGSFYMLADHIKPYLFHLSSMTEEQKEELLEKVVGKDGIKYFKVLSNGSICSTDAKEQDLYNFVMHFVNFDKKTTTSYIDWLNKNHFDYRGLIEKSLAIDATNKNIY
jgi:hypothetical protein